MRASLKSRKAAVVFGLASQATLSSEQCIIHTCIAAAPLYDDHICLNSQHTAGQHRDAQDRLAWRQLIASELN